MSAVADVVRAWMASEVHEEETRMAAERALLIGGLYREMEQQ